MSQQYSTEKFRRYPEYLASEELQKDYEALLKIAQTLAEQTAALNKNAKLADREAIYVLIKKAYGRLRGEGISLLDEMLSDDEIPEHHRLADQILVKIDDQRKNKTAPKK